MRSINRRKCRFAVSTFIFALSLSTACQMYLMSWPVIVIMTHRLQTHAEGGGVNKSSAGQEAGSAAESQRICHLTNRRTIRPNGYHQRRGEKAIPLPTLHQPSPALEGPPSAFHRSP